MADIPGTTFVHNNFGAYSGGSRVLIFARLGRRAAAVISGWKKVTVSGDLFAFDFKV